MRGLTDDERAILEPILTVDDPLGPSNADEIPDLTASTLLLSVKTSSITSSSPVLGS